MKNFCNILRKIGSGKSGLLSLLAVVLLIGGVNNAMALGVCSYPPSAAKVTVNKEITVDKNQPVGAILGTYNSSQQYILANNCAGQYKPTTRVDNSIFATVDGDTFESGVPGVGVRVTIDNVLVYQYTLDQILDGDGKNPIYIQTVKVDFVKIGTTAPGTATSGKIISTIFEDSSGRREVFSVNIGSVIVKQSSCDITGSSAIPVPMGKVNEAEFSGKNSTLSPVNVQIPLQCFADTTVNISFDAASTLGNGIIDLTKGGAEGVGIQLKMSDKVVVFDQKTFVTKTTQEGAFNIPLTAAYIQTADTIKPGIANAVANFTVTYE
ncbi:fimbrial protein [Rahnella variigena]|uniref:fimbrial protein n=1 Tax=Rahnella variigena TaxID=574964 RepID=UPI001330DE1E|nr:fimbrial protein [Rahnella variigena]